jgi:hypothetical protein
VGAVVLVPPVTALVRGKQDGDDGSATEAVVSVG